MILKKPYGFTLVEIIVVITIMATLMAFSIPVFQGTGVFTTRMQGVKDLAGLITSLKYRAMRENHDIFLHIDPAGDHIWMTDTSMDGPALETAKASAFELTQNLRISEIEFARTPSHDRENTPTRSIRFSRQGYSDLVILHLDGADTPVSLKIEPFLMDVETVFDRISFDDCT
ncbi:MAG: Tfp pilus assembly protein FimT/FimU [Desulfotignum sp.]|nr:prepilin-type N-terminal cleavage/methylation domain-containing protein [Desulfobacteraceae bacterium]